MEGVNGLQPIASHPIVRDRPGGQSGQSRDSREAFQRALQQHAKAGAGNAAPEEPEQGEAEQSAEAGGEAPVRTGLQPRPAAGRKEEQARHIDVLA